MSVEQTNPDSIPIMVNQLRSFFNTGETLSAEWRIRQLQGIVKFLKETKDEWINAQNADLGSHESEAKLLVGSAISEVEHTIDNVKSWMKPRSMSNPMVMKPGGTEIVPEPYGVVCDFIPYNYPLFLGISTLCPIFAAGNVCLFKPSSNTPACSRLYFERLPQYLDPRGFKVVSGPTSICTNVLACKFDFIFYTGSPAVARTIMQAAVPNLTPVLLELGGKSPVYIDTELSLEKCCRRLCFGKFFNGGQTCVAPDYILCNQAILDKFIGMMKKIINEFYGDVTTKYNDNITHIVNERHFDRIVNAIETSGGEIIVKGLTDKSRKYIGPTLIKNPSLESELMTKEIFGPVFPIIPVNNEDDAIKFINEREKPLALYVMSSRDDITKKFIQRTSSGAIVINDCVFHCACADVPFGGVGNSGMGQYHGLKGFETLSHMKPVMTHSTFFDVDSKYPPYTKDKSDFVLKFV